MEKKLYLYHKVPEKMQGKVLYPLNGLEKVNLELYLKEIKKYDEGHPDRKNIPGQYIPKLDCKWGDILQLTAIHPEELKKALVEAGFKDSKELKFYQIDPEILDSQKTIVYLYKDTPEESVPYSENFIDYDSNNLEQHTVIAEVTKKSYQERAKKGMSPILFVGIPHIFHKGQIDISNCPVITV